MFSFNGVHLKSTIVVSYSEELITRVKEYSPYDNSNDSYNNGRKSSLLLSDFIEFQPLYWALGIGEEKKMDMEIQ